MSIYTIGHSTLWEDDFYKIAKPCETIIDIRSHPTSRWLQFRKENMEEWIPDFGKKYEWEPALGGWSKLHLPLASQMADVGVNLECYAKGKFPKQRIALTKTHGEKPVWYNQGLYDYSFFMTLPEFLGAADNLIIRGQHENIGILCCECLYWQCHRSMVADFIVWRGSDAIHLQPKLTRHSTVIGNRLDRYDNKIKKIWQEWVDSHPIEIEQSAQCLK